MVIGNVLMRQSQLLHRLPILLARSMNKNPIVLAASMSSMMTKSPRERSPLDSRRGLLLADKVSSLSVRGSATEVQEIPPSHAKKFYLERAWAVGMLPLFPAALFIHNPFMDYALATAIGLHIHWGMEAVIEDYARPFVIGETLAKLAKVGIYVFSLLMYVGLLHFNYADVGITKGFEMIWSL